jgi:Arc/MetJ-type ribon-helix-helix transcriptional regulator
MTKKIAISLPDATLRKAKAAVKSGKAANVSNYVARLIEHASATETFEEMIADWMRESGATQAEINEAEEESREAFERAGLVPKEKRREKQAPRKAS